MRILIVKLSSLGDVVHAMPAVQDIRRAVPQARMDWVVEPAFADLVRRCDGVERAIECGLRQWRRAPFARASRQGFLAFRAQLQAQRYDAVIDLQGLTKSALVAWLARLAPGGLRHALAHRTDGSGYEAPTRWVADRCIATPRHIHAVDRSRLLCAQALGYPAGGPEVFGLRPADRPDRSQGLHDADDVVLVHGTSRADKLWPEDHWIALARRLVAQGHRLGLPHGSDEEWQRAQRLAAAVGEAARPWPRLSLADLADRMARAAGVIGVDSGLSHLATALDRPHVQIYNHDTAWRTGPVGRLRQVSVVASPTPSVEAVWAAWQRVHTVKGDVIPEPAA